MKFVWTPPSLFPIVVPWLAVLGLLLVKGNRTAQSWWIWLPLAAVPAVVAVCRNYVPGVPSETANIFGDAAIALAFGIAGVWLLGHLMTWKNRFLTLLGTLPVMAALGALSFFMGLAEQGGFEAMYSGILLAIMILVLAVGLCLTGLLCRRRYQVLRVSILALLLITALWFLVLTPFYVFAIMASGGGVQAAQFFGGALVMALTTFLALLPFLLLSFASPFYRERLKDLLYLRPLVPPPPVIPPETKPEPASLAPLSN